MTTEHDFYATHEALRLSGARVRRVSLYDDPRQASVDEIVTRLRRAVTARTRLVALTWVHSSTGVKLPLRQIADALPERVLVCVDGVHGLAAEADTVRSLRCDAFASGCHKWLYGPRGTGVLWAGPRVRELMRPAIPSFDDGESYGAWLAGRAPSGDPDGARLTPGRVPHLRAPLGAHGGLPVPRGRSDVRGSRLGFARSSPVFGPACRMCAA